MIFHGKEAVMIKTLLKSSSFIFCFFIISCTSGHCVRDGLPARELSEKGLDEATANQEVLVSKPDGSRQCGAGAIIPLETMAKELSGIEILNQEKKTDGLVRIQMCGHPTGSHNVYKIKRKDLNEASNRGFKVFGVDPRLKK